MGIRGGRIKGNSSRNLKMGVLGGEVEIADAKGGGERGEELSRKKDGTYRGK